MARKLNIVLNIALVVVASMLHVSLGQTTHVVGDRLGWTVPPGGDIAYRTWAATQTFTVGDVLVFNFTTGTHDVAEVNRDEYNSCNSTSPISTSTSGPTRITLTTAGQHNFICNFPSHCSLGQRLSINVSAATATTPSPAPQAATPTPTATPEMVPSPASTPAAAPTPSRTPTTHIVGNSLGWTVPPGGIAAYQTWARDQSFMVGDILVFNFTTGAHDVAEVSRTGYDSCNTNPNTNIINNGPARVTLTSAGEHHYICTIPSHCSLGQRLAINVTDAGGATSMPPSSTTPAPSGSAPPPPNNSASSLGVKALPFTFLAIALALFYY